MKKYLLILFLIFINFNCYSQERTILKHTCNYTIQAMVVEYSLSDSFIRVQLSDSMDTNIYVLHIVESSEYTLDKHELFNMLYIGSTINICEKEFTENLDLNHTMISLKGIMFNQ